VHEWVPANDLDAAKALARSDPRCGPGFRARENGSRASREAPSGNLGHNANPICRLSINLVTKSTQGDIILVLARFATEAISPPLQRAAFPPTSTANMVHVPTPNPLDIPDVAALRCGVQRNSMRTNVLIHRPGLSEVSKATFTNPPPDKTFGVPKMADPEGARDVTMMWKEHVANPDSVPGALSCGAQLANVDGPVQRPTVAPRCTTTDTPRARLRGLLGMML
jgi:Domain of unknown function (DUF4483)